MRLFARNEHKIGETARIENYSDAFLAIIITLLVIELHIPELEDASIESFLWGFGHILPNITAFAFSFVTLAVFWVNHHHFFHELHKADWRLLWYNNALLFWLALVPFTTAFLAEYPTVPAVGALYAFVLTMAALSFMLMNRHAMYVADLLDAHISEEQKSAHYRRGWIGVFCYGLAAITAFIYLPITVVLVTAMPIFYIVPNLMHDHDGML